MSDPADDAMPEPEPTAAVVPDDESAPVEDAAPATTPAPDAAPDGKPVAAAADAKDGDDGAGPDGAGDDPDADASPPAAPDEEALERPADGAEIATIKPLAHRLEALIFASAQPLSTARLSKLVDAPVDDLKPVLEELHETWSQRPGAVELVEIAGGWRFMTRPAFHDDLLALAAKKGTDRLSPAALETLAVVAYRQPITREEIEGIRGVQSGPLLRALLERDLIRIKGRSKKPGHPLLYGTTKRFLDHFGLKNIKSLPDLKDLLDA